MIKTQDPSRAFIQYVAQKTGASIEQILDGTKTLDSVADGPAEMHLQPLFEGTAKVTTFVRDLLSQHPELKDQQGPSSELDAQLAPLQHELEAQPKEARDLGGEIIREVQPRGDDRMELMPSAFSAGPEGMFSVTLSRVGDDYRDKAPEPFGIGEPRRQIFIDTTPGVAGIQFFVQDVSPRPRAEFLQTIAAASGRLPEAVARDVKMYNASADNPIKTQLTEPLKLLAEVVNLTSTADGRPIKDPSELDAAGQERMKELEGLMEQQEKQHPKLRAALQEVFEPMSEHVRDPIPSRFVEHGNGIYEVGFKGVPRGADTPQDGGTMYLDMRPGLAGYCSYYQPAAAAN